MADDWVSDVRSWYFSTAPGATADPAGRPESPEIGYEAAYPELQTRDWVEVSTAAADFDRR